MILNNENKGTIIGLDGKQVTSKRKIWNKSFSMLNHLLVLDSVKMAETLICLMVKAEMDRAGIFDLPQSDVPKEAIYASVNNVISRLIDDGTLKDFDPMTGIINTGSMSISMPVVFMDGQGGYVVVPASTIEQYQTEVVQ